MYEFFRCGNGHEGPLTRGCFQASSLPKLTAKRFAPPLPMNRLHPSTLCSPAATSVPTVGGKSSPCDLLSGDANVGVPLGQCLDSFPFPLITPPPGQAVLEGGIDMKATAAGRTWRSATATGSP